MGALITIKLKYAEKIGERWQYREVARPESSSPATGSAASHRVEQKRLLEAAFGDLS